MTRPPCSSASVAIVHGLPSGLEETLCHRMNSDWLSPEKWLNNAESRTWRVPQYLRSRQCIGRIISIAFVCSGEKSLYEEGIKVFVRRWRWFQHSVSPLSNVICVIPFSLYTASHYLSARFLPTQQPLCQSSSFLFKHYFKSARNLFNDDEQTEKREWITGSSEMRNISQLILFVINQQYCDLIEPGIDKRG